MSTAAKTATYSTEDFNGILLVADNSPSVHQTITQMLADTFTINCVRTKNEVFACAHSNDTIACIILDVIAPEFGGFATTHKLKTHFRTWHIPVIVLINQISIGDMILAVEMGADDYLQKPFSSAELLTRVLINVKRSQRDQNANSLTKLAGNSVIDRTITQRLKNPLAILYVDIDHFKIFNDTYGFDKGNEVIKQTATLLATVLQHHGIDEDFLGHVGGDDFIVITQPDRAKLIAEALCTAFDTLAPSFYPPSLQKQKTFITQDRQGKQQEYPFISLSIAIMTNKHRSLISTVHIAQLSAELKRFAKSKPGGIVGSNYVFDRRRE